MVKKWASISTSPDEAIGRGLVQHAGGKRCDAALGAAFAKRDRPGDHGAGAGSGDDGARIVEAAADHLKGGAVRLAHEQAFGQQFRIAAVEVITGAAVQRLDHLGIVGRIRRDVQRQHVDAVIGVEAVIGIALAAGRGIDQAQNRFPSGIGDDEFAGRIEIAAAAFENQTSAPGGLRHRLDRRTAARLYLEDRTAGLDKPHIVIPGPCRQPETKAPRSRSRRGNSGSCLSASFQASRHVDGGIGQNAVGAGPLEREQGFQPWPARRPASRARPRPSTIAYSPLT